MKLERVNDNQIRCILTREDLEERKLKFSELTYGSEKANRLFRDVMQQANYLFGFEIDDSPLMIEAVPMQSGKVVFVITKVEQPDEFESHISQFKATLDETTPETAEAPENTDTPHPIEVTSATVSIPIADGDQSGILPVLGQALHELFHEMISRQQAAAQETKKKTELQDRLFSFTDMSTLLDAAAATAKCDIGDSALYKDPADGRYYILIRAEHIEASAYKALCMLMSDFCEHTYAAQPMEAHIDEHFDLLLANRALQSLAQVSLGA